jgi:hypothetical protein
LVEIMSERVEGIETMHMIQKGAGQIEKFVCP